MQPRMKIASLGIGILAIVLGSLFAGTPRSSATRYRLQVPGGAATITSLVQKSTSLSDVPNNLRPSLLDMANDNVLHTRLHAGGCIEIKPECIFGVKSSNKLVVLFGDSHAWMWIAAVLPELTKLNYRVQLIWKPSCPAATISVWYTDTKLPYRACDTWRRQMISYIASEHPRLVILSERTTHLMKNARSLTSNHAVQTGLELTIRELRRGAQRVAVIGDIAAFANYASPAQCLSVHLKSIQLCATTRFNHSATWANHAHAEQVGARATHAAYIDPTQWLCHRETCSVIIGNFGVYTDWSHVTATYSSYLSAVFGDKLKSILSRPPTNVDALANQRAIPLR